jgi:hypothetical protein
LEAPTGPVVHIQRSFKLEIFNLSFRRPLRKEENTTEEEDAKDAGSLFVIDDSVDVDVTECCLSGYPGEKVGTGVTLSKKENKRSKKEEIINK